MRVFVSPNTFKEGIVDYTSLVCKTLGKLGVETVMEPELSNQFACCKPDAFCEYDVVINYCDAVIVLGGDGTILRAAKRAAKHDVPVLGINYGRLGFLAGLENANYDGLKRLVDGNYTVEKRMMLKAEIGGSYFPPQLLLNDAVVSRGSVSRILDFHVSHNKKTVFQYRGDGLIVSTPTGSTAYSLSAGGPVVDPGLSGMILTPICPHSLFSRSVVFSGDSVLEIKSEGDIEGNIYLTVDGDGSFEIASGETVVIKKAKEKASFIRINDKNFYEVLNEKFM